MALPTPPPIAHHDANEIQARPPLVPAGEVVRDESSAQAGARSVTVAEAMARVTHLRRRLRRACRLLERALEGR